MDCVGLERDRWTGFFQFAFPSWVFEDVAAWSHALSFNITAKSNLEINICMYTHTTITVLWTKPNTQSIIGFHLVSSIYTFIHQDSSECWWRRTNEYGDIGMLPAHCLNMFGCEWGEERLVSDSLPQCLPIAWGQNSHDVSLKINRELWGSEICV